MGYSLEQLAALGIFPVELTPLAVDGPKVTQKQGKPEDEFQSAFLVMAKLCGWHRAHFRRALTKTGRWVTPVSGDGKGFPDLLMIHEEWKRIFVAELKVNTSPSPQQKHWLRLFNMVGIPAYLWRPKHWDTIQAILEGREKPCTQVEPKSRSSARKRKSKRHLGATEQHNLPVDGIALKVGPTLDSTLPSEQ